jgi:hypothetical protein
LLLIITQMTEQARKIVAVGHLYLIIDDIGS